MRGEREMLTLAWLVPFVMAPIASASAVQVGPFVLAGITWMAWRRVRFQSVLLSTDVELAAIGAV